MSATVESQIKVYIRAFIQGQPEVKAFSESLKNLQKTASTKTTSGLSKVGDDAKKMGQHSLFAAGSMRVLHAAMSPLAGIGKLIAGVFAQVVRQVQFVAASFAILIASSPALFFGLLIKEGIEFNSMMETQKIGLAALIQSTNTLFRKDSPNKPLEGLQAYEAATAIAKESTDRLSVKIIPLKATLEELLPVFNQIVTAGAAAGLSLEQTETVFTDLAATAQVVNIPLDKLGTGIRLLLNGTARATTVLATALFGSAKAANDFVKQHKAIGDLFPALEAKLEPFRIALLTSETSFATMAANTKDVFQRLAGIATSGLFDKLKLGLVLILKSFYDLKTLALKPEFQALFDFIGNALANVGDYIVSLIEKVIGYLGDIASYVQENGNYVSAILGDLQSIFIELGGILGDMVSIVGEANSARDETTSWHVILGFAAITLGAIRDIFDYILGLVQAITGGLVSGVFQALQGILLVLGLVSERAHEAASAMGSISTFGSNFANAGRARVEASLSTPHGLAATDRFLNGNPNIPTNRPKNATGNDFTAHLKKLGRGAGAGGGGKGGGAKDDGSSKLTDSVRGLEDSRLDLILAGFETRVSRVQFLMDAAKQALDRQLSNHLISISAYYAKLLETEKTTIEAEIVEQQARRERDAATIDAKIKELEAKRTKAKNPKEAQAFTNDIEAQRNKAAEKELEYTEKIAQQRGKITEAEQKSLFASTEKLNALRDQTFEVQAQMLALQNRSADSDIIGIAGQFSSKILDSLSNFDAQLGDPIKKVIEDINVLGRVTSQNFQSILADNGVEFSALSEETKQLIALMQRLEQNSQFKGLQAGIQQVKDRLAQDITEIRAKVTDTNGVEQDSYAAIIAATKGANIEIQGLLDKAEKLALATGDQGFLLYIRQIKSELHETNRTSNLFAESVNGILRDSFSGFVDDILAGNGSILDSFRKMASGMLIQMAKLIFQAVIMKTIFAALGISSGGGGFGGKLAGFLGIGGGPAKKAEGGIMSGPGTGTSDSIPALLSHGEAVIPANMVSRFGTGMISSLIDGSFASHISPMRFAAGGFVDAGSGGSRGGTNVRNVNVLDPNLLEDYVNTAGGERVLLNIISRNPIKIKQSLGL